MSQAIHILLPKFNFRNESFEDFKNRYNGFGKDLYQHIQNEIAPVFNNLQLYRSTNFQTSDSYAIFDNGKHTFAMQLDPESEMIILWNENTQNEFGTWTDDLYVEIINEIRYNRI